MNQIKVNDIVKFKVCFDGENPNQCYKVLEAHFDVDQPRALIEAIGTGLTFAPTYVILIDEIETI